MDASDTLPKGRLGIDWGGLADLAVDPYLIWADLSDFSGTPRPGGVAQLKNLSVALELQAGAAAIGVPYRTLVADGQRIWATATVSPAQLAGLLTHRSVLRLELGFAGSTRPAPARAATPRRVADR